MEGMLALPRQPCRASRLLQRNVSGDRDLAAGCDRPRTRPSVRLRPESGQTHRGTPAIFLQPLQPSGGCSNTQGLREVWFPAERQGFGFVRRPSHWHHNGHLVGYCAICGVSSSALARALQTVCGIAWPTPAAGRRCESSSPAHLCPRLLRVSVFAWRAGPCSSLGARSICDSAGPGVLGEV